MSEWWIVFFFFAFPEADVFCSGWIINTALTELSAEKAAESAKKDKMRKDLKSAFELAAAHHPLDYYKDILRSFEEEMKAAAEAAALAAATPKKSKKGKSKADGEDEDVEMGDGTESVKKAKKRKAEEETSVSTIRAPHAPHHPNTIPRRLFPDPIL